MELFTYLGVLLLIIPLRNAIEMKQFAANNFFLISNQESNLMQNSDTQSSIQKRGKKVELQQLVNYLDCITQLNHIDLDKYWELNKSLLLDSQNHLKQINRQCFNLHRSIEQNYVEIKTQTIILNLKQQFNACVKFVNKIEQEILSTQSNCFVQLIETHDVVAQWFKKNGKGQIAIFLAQGHEQIIDDINKLISQMTIFIFKLQFLHKVYEQESILRIQYEVLNKEIALLQALPNTHYRKNLVTELQKESERFLMKLSQDDNLEQLAERKSFNLQQILEIQRNAQNVKTILALLAQKKQLALVWQNALKVISKAVQDKFWTDEIKNNISFIEQELGNYTTNSMAANKVVLLSEIMENDTIALDSRYINVQRIKNTMPSILQSIPYYWLFMLTLWQIQHQLQEKLVKEELWQPVNDEATLQMLKQMCQELEYSQQLQEALDVITQELYCPWDATRLLAQEIKYTLYL
jgi:hypothetical protein